MPTQSKQIYQIKVTLDDTYPPVWRRFQVPANTTLLKLHDILQIVMGWVDYHLHMFTIEGRSTAILQMTNMVIWALLTKAGSS
jgi:hypothetical protein